MCAWFNHHHHSRSQHLERERCSRKKKRENVDDVERSITRTLHIRPLSWTHPWIPYSHSYFHHTRSIQALNSLLLTYFDDFHYMYMIPKEGANFTFWWSKTAAQEVFVPLLGEANFKTIRGVFVPQGWCCGDRPVALHDDILRSAYVSYFLVWSSCNENRSLSINLIPPMIC